PRRAESAKAKNACFDMLQEFGEEALDTLLWRTHDDQLRSHCGKIQTCEAAALANACRVLHPDGTHRQCRRQIRGRPGLRRRLLHTDAPPCGCGESCWCRSVPG